ncbi:MAG: hypothetical protein LDL26_09575 [Caenispirillum bisanense]|nr:hypothetical protein [Caenispirillum bisanense]MCA1973928.1 hypothetical protein [Caenispirillum sp.]
MTATPPPTGPTPPPSSYGPPPILKAVVIGLIAGALSLSLELTLGGAEPNPWRSLGLAFGLGAGYFAYETWLRRRRKMLAEGQNPDGPTRPGS